jgi:hypothetical protein
LVTITPAGIGSLERAFANSVVNSAEQVTAAVVDDIEKVVEAQAAKNIVPFVRGRSNASGLTSELVNGAQTAASLPSQISNAIVTGGIPAAAVLPTLSTGNPIIDGVGGAAIGVAGAFVPVNKLPDIIAGVGEKAAALTGSVVGGIGNTTGFVNKAIGSEKVGNFATSIKNTGDNIKNAGISAMKPLHVASDMMGAPFQMMRESQLGALPKVGSTAVENIREQTNKLGINNQQIDLKFQQIKDKISGFEDKITDGAKKSFNKIVGEERAGAIIENVSKQNTYATVRKVAAVGTIVAQNSNTIHGFVESYDKLAEMYADLKGVSLEKIKPTDVLFDNKVDPLFERARKETMGNILPAAMISVVSNIAQWKLSCNPNISTGISGKMGAIADIGSTLAAVMLPQMALGMVKPQSDVLDLHHAAMNTYEAYGVIPSELGVQILQNLSPSFSGRSQAIAVNVLANYFEEKAFTPQQIFDSISSSEAASLGYQLMDERAAKMQSYGLIDPNIAEQKMVPISHQSNVVVPQDQVYNYSLIKRAGSIDELAKAVAGFISETQPAFANGGVNASLLPQVAQIAAIDIAQNGTQAEDVVKLGSADLVLDSLKMMQMKQKPNAAVISDSVESQGLVSNKELAITGAGVRT